MNHELININKRDIDDYHAAIDCEVERSNFVNCLRKVIRIAEELKRSDKNVSVELCEGVRIEHKRRYSIVHIIED